jgi:hypothetical protein
MLRPDYCPALSERFELMRSQFAQVLDELWTFLFHCCMDSASVTALLPAAHCGAFQYIVFWAGHMRALCLYLIVFPAQVCNSTYRFLCLYLIVFPAQFRVQSVCEQ